MLGEFSKTALLLFPTEVNTEPRYFNIFSLSVRKYSVYLLSVGVQPYVFSTDSVALEMHIDNVKYYNLLSEADEFFAKRNCEGMSVMPEGEHLDDIIKEVLKKYPNQPGLNREQRFDLLQKREKAAAREFIKQCRFVTNFARGKMCNYKSESKDGDGLLRVQIDPNTLMLSVKLSGKQIPVYNIFDFDGSSKPIYQWEVS